LFLPSEDLPEQTPPKTLTVDYENQNDLKCNEKTHHCLLTEHQYDDGEPLFEPSCSSTELRLISQADV
jgi:hypothetical protein